MPTRIAVICGAALLVSSACAGDDAASEATITTRAPTTTTTAPPTTATTSTTAPPTTSTTSTTTTSTTTTAPPTTTTSTTTTAPPVMTSAPSTTTASAPLPQPIAPPSDPDAHEPLVHLGSIAIPAIGVDVSMYEGIRMPTLDHGPGHWPGTAMPGEVGNVVVAGHRVSHNADFRHLDQLQPGHEVIFTTLGGTTFTYVVDGVEIVEPHDTWIVDQSSDKTATLFACHPPGSVAQRIVAHLTLAT